MNRWLCAALALGWATLAGAQQAYRWVDAEGHVTYSDRPPPPGAASAETRKLRGSVIETSVPPYAVQQAAKDYPVTLYTAPNCDACAAARSLLEKRGVPFSTVNVSDPPSIEELKRVSGGAQVPVMKVGSDVIKMFEPGQYNSALDAAGYPRSVPTYAMPKKPEASGAPGAADTTAAPAEGASR